MRFTGNLHRLRAQPTGGLALDPAITCGFRAPYKAKANACHPSVVFFKPFWRRAHRSGRRAWVRASASALRQAATLTWSPDNRISGIGTPSKPCGRVYCGYSSSPSEKLSSAPDSAFPITPGSSRTQASISANAAISPPESTKSPIDTSSSCRVSITRWSTPSKRPQTISGPGPAVSWRTRDWVNGRPRGLIKRRGRSFGFSGSASAASIATASTSARKTMPGPPPAGVSSTLRWRSVAESRMSRASSAHRPEASALPARLRPSGPGNISGNKVSTVARQIVALAVMLLPLRHNCREIEPLHQGRRLDRLPEVRELVGRHHDLLEIEQAFGRECRELARRGAVIHELANHFPVVRQHLAERQFQRHFGAAHQHQ